MTPSTSRADNVPVELHPCEHMVNLISRRSDDTLVGPAKWYTDFHVLTCPNCKGALKGLRELRAELAIQIELIPKDRPRLGPEEWKSIEKGWQSADSTPAP